jgi:hypothetical protein
MQLRTVGVRGCVEELLTALDSTLVRGKVLTAAFVGLLSSVLLLLAARYRPGQEFWPPLPLTGAGLVVLTLFTLYSVLTTQRTFVELSRLRPATRAEAHARRWGNAFRLILTELLTGGVLLLLIGGLRWLNEWLG